MQPVVSVIVPAYNSANYITETLKSILNQKLQELEVIVVDDCSTDKTRDIVRGFEDSRIVYHCLNKNHGGPSLPRSKGISIAKAPYIAFCDSDDLLMPNMLLESSEFLKKYQELGMCFWDVVRFDNQTREEQPPLLSAYTHFKALLKTQVEERRFLIRTPNAFHGLFYENFIQLSSAVVPRHVFNTVGFFDHSLKNADDWDMWLKIAKQYPIGFIDSIGFKYRVRKGSISGRGPSLFLNRIKVLQKYYATDLPHNVKKQIRNLMAANYFGAGYAYRIAGQALDARKFLIKSFVKRPSYLIPVELLFTYLSKPLYAELKKIKMRYTMRS